MTAPAPISHLSANGPLTPKTLEWVATKLAEDQAHKPVSSPQKPQRSRPDYKRLWKGQRQQSASLEAMSEKQLLIQVLKELQSINSKLSMP